VARNLLLLLSSKFFNTINVRLGAAVVKRIGVLFILMFGFSALADSGKVLLTCPRNANGNSGSLIQDGSGQLKFEFKRPNYRRATIKIARISNASYYTENPKQSSDGLDVPAIRIEKADYGHMSTRGWFRATISAEYLLHYETVEHYVIDCRKP
jgi:hypothetical protein